MSHTHLISHSIQPPSLSFILHLISNLSPLPFEFAYLQFLVLVLAPSS